MSRPRIKNRPRYPSGKLKPESTMSPTMVRRIVDQARASAANPLLGSELGQLRLAGVVSDREVSAGLRYAELVTAHHRLKGIPSPSAKSASWEGGYGLSVVSDPDPETVERTTKQYLAACAVLQRFGRWVLSAVDSICINDRPILSTSHIALCSGLSALALHFGLTTRDR